MFQKVLDETSKVLILSKFQKLSIKCKVKIRERREKNVIQRFKFLKSSTYFSTL